MDLVVEGERAGRTRGGQRTFEVHVEAQRKSALLGRQARRPADGAQRDGLAVDGHAELAGERRGKLLRVVVALALRGHAVAIGVGEMQLAQCGKLPEHDGVPDIDRMPGQADAAVLVDREVAEEACHRVRADGERSRRQRQQRHESAEGEAALGHQWTCLCECSVPSG
jgi:hypothetical protein